MIELTEQQQQELEHGVEPVQLLDPTTRTKYILVRADLHARLQELLEQVQVEAWADAVEEARHDPKEMPDFQGKPSH